MKLLRLGDFRQIVDHQTATYSQGSYLQQVPTWTTAGSYPAAVSASIGGEFVVAEWMRAKNPIQVTMRYVGDLDPIKPKDRLLLGGRTFNIESVINVDERNYMYSILCTEVVS